MISLVSINFFLIISQSIIASVRKRERETELTDFTQQTNNTRNRYNYTFTFHSH